MQPLSSQSQQVLSMPADGSQWLDYPFHKAVLLFPFVSLKALVLPSADRFDKLAGDARWDLVLFYLLVQAVYVGLLAFLWGRISLLSLGDVTQRLQPGVIWGAALSLPVLFFISTGIMQFMAKRYDGQASYLEQCYGVMVVMLPMVLVETIIILFALCDVRLHTPFYAFSIVLGMGLLIYWLIVLRIAECGVQDVSGGEATTIVLVPFIAVLVIIVIVGLALLASESGLFEGNGSNSSSKRSDSGKSKQFGGGSSGSFGSNGGNSSYGSDSASRGGTTGLLAWFEPGNSTYSGAPYYRRARRRARRKALELRCAICNYCDYKTADQLTGPVPCPHCNLPMQSVQ